MTEIDWVGDTVGYGHPGGKCGAVPGFEFDDLDGGHFDSGRIGLGGGFGLHVFDGGLRLEQR